MIKMQPKTKPWKGSRSGQHARNQDRAEHSKEESKFRETFGKWPSALELDQAMPFLQTKRGAPDNPAK